jgi:hypothetical protein
MKRLKLSRLLPQRREFDGNSRLVLCVLRVKMRWCMIGEVLLMTMP